MTATFLLAGFAPALAHAVGADLTAPLPDVPRTINVLAVSGTRILANFEGAYWLSTNSGGSWTTANLPLAPCPTDGDEDCSFSIGGLDSGVLPVSRDNTVAWYSLLSNAETGVRHTDTASLTAANGKVAVFDDGTGGSRFVRSDGQTWTLGASVGASPDGVFADGSALDNTYPDVQKLIRVGADGSKRVLAVASVGFPDLDGWRVGGNLLAYTRTDASGSEVCLVSATTASAASCVDLPSDAFGGWPAVVSSAGVLIGAETGLAFAPIHSGVLNPAVLVRVPATADQASTHWQDAQGPVLSLADSKRSWLARVDDSGALSELSSQTAVQTAEVGGLGLTPTSLVGANTQHGDKWARSVGSSLGAQQPLSAVPWRASVVASAGRWAVPQGTSVRLYDNDGATSKDITGESNIDVSRLSGPYLLGIKAEGAGDSRLWSQADGWQTTSAKDLFGSLLLEPAGTNTFTVRDRTGASSPITTALPAGDYGDIRIWGDWLATTHFLDASDEVTVKNYRTGILKSRLGNLCALGDGAVVLSRWVEATDTTSYEVWDFRHDTVTPLTGPFDWNAMFAFDGSRLAYNTTTNLVVKQLDGIGASAPRTLGVVAPASFDPWTGSWSADIDLTKPVKAGELRITTSTGTMVRAIPVPASNNGSLRGITWNGKDAAGAVVLPGTYNFALTSTDAAGAPVAAVDGTNRAIGKVQVLVPHIVGSSPVISGPAVVGGSLTATFGSWTPPVVRLAYQWLRDGQPISAATGARYVAGVADADHAIAVRVTGSYGGASLSVTSSAVRVVKASFSSFPQPVVSGIWFYAKTLHATVGTWVPTPDSLAYQWLRDGQPISGATTASYTLGGDDVAHLVSVRLTGAKAGFTPVQTYSAAQNVDGFTFTRTASVAVSGTAKVGKTVKAKVGKFSPTPKRVTYQWLRNGVAIGGATASRMTLTPADRGATISVKVTGSKTGFVSASRTSKSTRKVAAGTLTAATPKISGKAQVGQVLRVKPGTWKPAGTLLTYQWCSNGHAIVGATGLTYTATQADKGKKLTVKVTGSKLGYTTATKTSKKTAKVK
ncbi:MAG TPA: FlgD immunoglobulin-like domain containing protein [Propionicimonas sp.]